MNELRSFLLTMGLKKEEIETLKPDTGSLCSNCKLRETSNWAILNPCQHKICFTCLDNLYDNYKGNLIDTMFNCPYCNSDVKDYDPSY